MALYSLLSDLLRCERYWYYPGTGGDSATRRYNYGTWWPQPTYHQDVDPQYYGYSLGIHRRCIMGGAYHQDKNYCGSRATRDDPYSTYVDYAVSARGCSQKKKNR